MGPNSWYVAMLPSEHSVLVLKASIILKLKTTADCRRRSGLRGFIAYGLRVWGFAGLHGFRARVQANQSLELPFPSLQ